MLEGRAVPSPSMFSSLIEALESAGPLLTLGVVILVAILLGALARRIHLPGITGQILAGVAMGPALLDVFGEEDLLAMRPMTHFALGLMAVTVGGHLNVRRLRNGHLAEVSATGPAPLVTVIYTDMLNAYRRVKDHALNVAEALAGEK